jgi:ATP-dependent Clp protease ATP-binding subunit ClpX
MDTDRTQYTCLFCGRRNDEVQLLIAGPKGAFICNECVAEASEIIAKEEAMAAQS